MAGGDHSAVVAGAMSVDGSCPRSNAAPSPSMDINLDGGGSSNGAPCSCSCLFCCVPDSLPSVAGARSLKRKLDEMEDVEPRTVRVPDVACVEIEYELAALREAVVSHHQSLQALHSELEEERAASATAASEAMSMILRLQREKADALMDARQFKNFAQEKMFHDQNEIALLEDFLFQQDQAVQSLSCEIQSYRHRLLSFGVNLSPSELRSPSAADGHAYPPLLCESADFPDDQYASGDTPRDSLQRIPSFVTDKVIIGNGYSPCRPLRRLSTDSFGSPSFGQEISGNNNEFPATLDRASDAGGSGKYDVIDRVYMVDAVVGVDGKRDDHMSTPRVFVRKDGSGGGTDELEMKRLYMRLQALEADRESMRQAILSMETDKAQVVLLKEIAQQLCKEVMPERRVVKKPSLVWRFPIISAIKWVTSFFFWRKKPTRIKYMFGLSAHNVGLLILLEKSQQLWQIRSLTRVQRCRWPSPSQNH